MPSNLYRSAILCIFSIGNAAAAGSDPALLGCWRSQQVQVTFADRSHTNQNGDCVVEYDATQAHSHCHNGTGEVETLSNYQLAGPGQLRVTVVDPATGNAKGPASDIHYRIEDEWLLIDRQFPPAPSSGSNKQPASLKSVSVRERSARCEPRGETGLRIGRTPRSSLAFSVPSGWEPYLVDPVNDKNVALAINTSLFIGAFTPRDVKTLLAGPSQLVMLLDDVRPGPIPVRASEFDSVKKQFAEERPAKELGTFQITCDQPDRVCGLLGRANGGFVYTELVNVKGRVVMVNGMSTALSESEATNVLSKSVRTFVQQLRSDNAK